MQVIQICYTHETNIASGFSLIELSIVLVILGLLTGGILAGQSLIRAAEMRAVSTEYSRYVTAAQTFRDKYFAIPGDMTNATSFWGKDNANCAANTGAIATPGTCNGDGSGLLTSISGSNERFRFWQHLALAGLIEGTYTGLHGGGGNTHALIGTNVPSSKLTATGWSVHRVNVTGDAERFDYDYGNHLMFGVAKANTATYGAALKPEEAWNIDTKLDDGKPAYGKVIAVYWNNVCTAPVSGAAASSNLNADYRLSDASIQCAFIFKDSF